MRVFLASSFCGMNQQDRAEFIEKGKPKYMLHTFFQGAVQCKSVLETVGRENFLLDSGAFSFMSGAKADKRSLEEYCEEYIDFINANDVKYYFELDVDTIFGIEFVEELRRKMERRTGKPCIPVWHKGRGVKYWEKMVDEYGYIAIGGLVFHVKASELEYIKQMVRYAKSKGVKVHGLGFTKTKILPEWDWYSVDSSSWTMAAARGQQRHDFNGHYIQARRIDGAGKKIILTKLIQHNGIEWCKYQRYMDSRRF